MLESLEEVKQILAHALQLGDRVNEFDAATSLLGSLPEFDSMAVVTLVTAMEDTFGFVIDDDEISAEIFETLGSLADFVESKLPS